MTKREGAIISAYTGVLVCPFEALHKYAEEKFDAPVWTHFFGDAKFSEELRELSRTDFVALCEGQTDG